jgi:large subunit ribosomal protein L9
VKVVLRQPVSKLGDPGDLVTVSGGYARNFLIPRGLAVVANKGNLKQASDWAKSKGAKAAKELSGAEALRDKLASRALNVTAQAGPDGRLFGSVTSSDVADALKAQLDVEIDRHDLELAEPIRHLGNHEVRVKLHPEVEATITVEVVAAG